MAKWRRIARGFRIAPWAIQLCIAAFFGGRDAAAEAAEVHLNYQAPQGCGSERAVLRQFHALIGGELLADSLDTRVVVERTDASLLLRFESTYRGVRSERALEVEDCESAIEAAAVLMLLTVDPAMAADLDVPLEPLPAPDLRAEPEPSTSASSPPPANQSENATTPTVSSEPRPQLEVEPDVSPMPKWLGLGASASSGATPEVALGAALEGGLSFRPVDLVLSFAGHLALRDDLDVAGGRLDASLWSARGRTQLRLHTRRVDFGPLVGVGVDRVSLSTGGVSSPGSGGTQWTSGRAGLFADVPLTGALDLDFNASLVVPFQRPRYRVLGVGVVHRPSAVGFEVFFGAAWHWGSQY